MVDTHTDIKAEITRRLDDLSPADLVRVLHYIDAPTGLPRGMTGAEFAALPVTMTPEEAAEMMQFIEEGCEQVNDSAW